MISSPTKQATPASNHFYNVFPVILENNGLDLISHHFVHAVE